MNKASLLVSALACAALAGCGARGDGEPVAGLSTDVSDFELLPSGFADLDLVLRPMRTIDETAELSLFVHLVDSKREVVRTFDRPLAEVWRPGESQQLRVRLYLSALVEPPAPGELSLTVGLYDPLLGRFALETDRRRVGKKEYELARVRIGARPVSPAQLEFVDGWADPEAQNERQTILQRPLRRGQTGSLRFGPIVRPTELWLQVGLPVGELGDEPIYRGGDRPWMRIASPCGAAPVEVVGTGVHQLSLRLEPDADGSCEIAIDSNYLLRRGKGGRVETPTLQVAAWWAP